MGAYVVMGRTDDALHYLAGLLQSNPKDTDALLLRSRVYLTLSQPSEAEKDLQAVLRIQPNSADAHYGLSECMACSDRKRIGSRNWAKSFGSVPAFSDPGSSWRGANRRRQGPGGFGLTGLGAEESEIRGGFSRYAQLGASRPQPTRMRRAPTQKTR